MKSEENNTGPGSLTTHQLWITIIAVLLAIFLSSLDQTVVATAMPDILAQLGGFQHYTFVTTAYLVASTTLIPITGKLIDIFGRKWFYTSGIIIFIPGSILSGLSQTLTQLIIFRAFQGIGGGIMISSAFAVIGAAEDNEQARYGYPRGHRTDCKQVCIGLAVSREGLPLGKVIIC